MSTSGRTTSLATEELQVLNKIGLYLLQDTLNLVLETAFWAGYAVLFLFAVYIQVSKGRKSLPTVLMLGATIFLFGSSTTLWGLDMYVIFMRIQTRLVENPTWPLDERLALSKVRSHRVGTPMEALFVFNMLVGDCVVIWRASVLWSGNRKVLAVPLTFFAGSFAFAIMTIVCLMNDGYSSKSGIPGGSRACTWAQPIAWAMSVVTNVVCTSLIAYKAWHHREFMKRNFSARSRKTQGEKVLLLLVESGVLYCLFWLFQVVYYMDVSRDENRVIWLYIVVATMRDQLSGLYPTGIIVLVALQQTVVDATSMHNYGATSNSTMSPDVVFATSTARPTTGTTIASEYPNSGFNIPMSAFGIHGKGGIKLEKSEP